MTCLCEQGIITSLMSRTITRTPPRGVSDLWYRLTAPREVSADAPLQQRELVRRGRVASFILLVIILLVILPIPTAIGNPLLLFTLLSVFLLDCFCLFVLNRLGHITLAGVLVVIGIEVGLGVSILTYPGGLGPSNLPLFDLLMQAEIVAVAMLAPYSVLVVAGVNAVFIVLVLHSPVLTPELAHLVATEPGRIIVQPITLLIAIAAIVIVLVKSANQAIRRADRAEEIAALERREIERQQREIEEKQQLDMGIQQILQTHVLVANGNFSARAPLSKDNVLWQIANSLNNLLARLQGYSQIQARLQRLQAENQQLYNALQRTSSDQSNSSAQDELQRTREAATRLVETLKRSRNGHIPPWSLQHSGTIIDAVVMQLSNPAVPLEPKRPFPAVQKIRTESLNWPLANRSPNNND